MKSEKISNQKKPLSLREWIDEVGIEETAKLLGAKPPAVYHWRRGHCLPRSREMLKIVKYSKGRVSYAEIIETFHGPKKAV